MIIFTICVAILAFFEFSFVFLLDFKAKCHATTKILFHLFFSFSNLALLLVFFYRKNHRAKCDGRITNDQQDHTKGVWNPCFSGL